MQLKALQIVHRKSRCTLHGMCPEVLRRTTESNRASKAPHPERKTVTLVLMPELNARMRNESC